MANRVFVSYVTEDLSLVEELVRSLRNVGVEIWLDRERILGGRRWEDVIRQAIAEGDFFVACFSAEYQAREHSYMDEELRLAVQRLREEPRDRAWFVPVKLTSCGIPPLDLGNGETLHAFQYIDLSEDWQAGMRKLIAALRPIGDAPVEHVHVFKAEDVEAETIDSTGSVNPPGSATTLSEVELKRVTAKHISATGSIRTHRS